MATDVINDHRGSLDQAAARSSELLSKEVGRFEDLLAELLEVSRFDAGAAILNTDQVDIAKLVAGEVDAVTPLAQDVGSQLEVVADGPQVVEIDSRRVRRVLRNLLINAVEHGEGRPVEVRVSGNGQAVAVTVRDYGVGLTAEQVPQIFDRFWRGDPSRNRRVGGIGLGLSIALEDAKLHGGRLGVWGEAGRGAQFRLVLPRTVGQSDLEPPLPLQPPTESGGQSYEP
jgi:two-component system sensor histidine kinase MtrB